MTATTRSRAGTSAHASASGRQQFAARRRRVRWRLRRPFVAVVLVLALLGGSVWLVLASPWLRVRSVSVVGGHRVSASAVIAAAEVPMREPLALVDTAGVRARVLEIPQVVDVRVSRHWPSTIVLTVVERVPVAAVRSGAGYVLVDAGGVAFDTARYLPDGLPVLAAPADAAGTAARAAAIRVLASLPDGVRSRLVRLQAPTADAVSLLLSGSVTVVWGSADRSAAKATVLSALMTAASAAATGRHPVRLPRVYDVSAPDDATTR